MNKIPLQPGRVVLSKAGRDAGRRFVVLRVDESFAYVADGDLRKVEALKKKKHRHLRALPQWDEGIAQMVFEGKMPTNAEVRNCLTSTTQDP